MTDTSAIELLLNPGKTLRVTVLLVILWGAAGTSLGQGVDMDDAPRPGKAFFRSLVIPGLGQQYAQGGSWKGKATAYLAADLGLWLGLVSSTVRGRALTDSYQSIAAVHANADVAEKNRTFYLNMANFASSEHYREALARARQWNLLEQARLPENEWTWDSIEHQERFAETRDDAESLRRQRPILISLMAANRLLSAIGALQTSRRARDTFSSLSVAAPPFRQASPLLQFDFRF